MATPNVNLGTLLSPTGHFLRAPSAFRSTIPSAAHPAIPNRYTLYISPSCPWAHRTNIVYHLKHLGPLIQLVYVDSMERDKGWCFTSSNRWGFTADPLYGGKYLRSLYERAAPGYDGRILVPMLWDREAETVVSNESSEIIRMLYSAFDAHLPAEIREDAKGAAGLWPDGLRDEIEAMNGWVYEMVNDGVYKAGFAASQEAYDENVEKVFAGLDRVEKHLGEDGHSPFLFGENLTEADIRLYPTIARFDVAYHSAFRCNLRDIRGGYPRIHGWLRRVYWGKESAFRDTTFFEDIKAGYHNAVGNKIVPKGPIPNILPLES